MKDKHLKVLSLILFIIGIGLFLYKVISLNFPLNPSESISVWTVEAKFTFKAQDKPVIASLYLPRKNQPYIITSEHFISRGYGVNTDIKDGARITRWSKRNVDGLQTLYYRAVVRRSTKKRKWKALAEPKIIPHGYDETNLSAAKSILSGIKNRSANTETMVSELLKILNNKTDNNVSLLLKDRKSITTLAKLTVAVKILSLEKIPARIVHGINIEKSTKHARIIHWLEVFEKGFWIPFNPITATRKIPRNYFHWWIGSDKIYDLEGGSSPRIRIAVIKTVENAVSDVIKKGKTIFPVIHYFSLFNLPVQTQSIYKILLVIPVGIVLLVFLRNVVGIKSFGTFTPVLIALAFRETQLLWGLILFSFVVSLGLGIRFYLDHLKLLLVPRLATVLTLVVLTLVFVSIISDKLGMERGLSIALFPMVILTMTIERMSIVWEEMGAVEAYKQGLGSLLIASLAYLFMFNKYTEHLTYMFPELLLILVMFTLWMGRYSGYRLIELYRFKEFAK